MEQYSNYNVLSASHQPLQQALPAIIFAAPPSVRASGGMKILIGKIFGGLLMNE